MIAEKVRLRRSEVANLASCGEWESDNSEAARFGSLVHSCIAEWVRLMCDPTYIDAHWTMEAAVTNVLLSGSQGVGAERFTEARDLCLRFADTHEARPETLLYVERTLEWEGKRVVLTGTPDRVDLLDAQTAMLTDWKTAWAQSEATDRYQMRFYSALLFLTDPSLQTVIARTDYLRLSEDSGVTEWTETRDDTLAWWHGEIVPLAEAIAARSVEEQQPVGGAACLYCAHRLTCAESVAPARNVPQTAEQARALASYTVRHEVAAEEGRAALRLWFREREPEVIAGEEWGFTRPREQVLRILDTPGAVRVLEEHGTTDAEGMLVLDQRRLVTRAKRVLLTAGVAELVDGEPGFRHRKATAR